MARVSFDAQFFIFTCFTSFTQHFWINPTIQQPVWRVCRSSAFCVYLFSVPSLRSWRLWENPIDFPNSLPSSKSHNTQDTTEMSQKRPNQTFKTIKLIKPIAIKHVQTPSNEHDSWQHLEHVVSLHTLSLYIILPIVPIVLALLSFFQHPSGDFYVSGSDFSSVSMSCFQISISWLTFFACDTMSQDIPPRQSNLLSQIIKWSNMKQYFGPQSELNCQLTSTKTKTCPE